MNSMHPMLFICGYNGLLAGVDILRRTLIVINNLEKPIIDFITIK